MSFLIANVASDQEYLEIFLVVRELLFDLMEESECLDRYLSGHCQEIISSQDKHLTKIPCLNRCLPDNVRKEADLPKVLVLD
jgi:hypothetical protein